tara:strand:+ start:395 stop:691 length:297 start_codon:yes stop_codon:yes gene_type:complete
MNNFDKLTNALFKAHPTSTWSNSTNEETYASFVWVDNAITEAEFDSAVAAYDALDYSRTRKAKYDLLNQFELISDDATNGTTTHKDAIAAIKAAHPKP